jgi:hypothetical protein
MTATTSDPFGAWLAQAKIPDSRLTSEQRSLLQYVFHFRQQKGTDYYSNRLLSHFLLHCQCGLKVAQIARLTDFGRQTASGQQDLSSKEAIQQAHHRMDGRPHGKLLPRYAGPIAGYVFAHPKATRADLIDFIEKTFGVRVSRIALYHFLKKFGLDQPPGSTDTPPLTPTPSSDTPALAPALPSSDTAAKTSSQSSSDLSPHGVLERLPQNIPELPAGRPIPSAPPPFSPHARNTPEPSSSSRRC